MEAIKALIKQIPTLELEKLDLIQSHQSDLLTIYEGIKNGSITSDQEVLAQGLLSKSSARMTLWRLKKDLQNKLSNTLAISPRTKATSIQLDYFEIYRDFFVANELMSRGETQAFVVIAEKVIEKAKKQELAEIVVALCRKLLRYYSTLKLNRKKYQKYRTLKEAQNKQLAFLERMEDIYTEVSLLIIENRKVSPKHLSFIENALNEATDIFNINPSQRIGVFYFMIQVYYSQFKNDVFSAVHYCEEALTFLQESDTDTPAGILFFFQIRLISSYIQLRKLDELKILSQQALAIIPKYSYNWHLVHLYQTTAALHTKQYDLALATLKTGLKQKKELYPATLEDYRILEGYTLFFLSDERPFRLGKFFNQTPIFSKDKYGNNTNILILQILFLLKQKKYSKIIDRTESLQQYVHNYLRQDDTFRTNCFIKMLCLLPKANFHPVAWERKTTTLYKKMTTLPVDKARMDIDVEKVPYEDLYAAVKEMLGRK